MPKVLLINEDSKEFVDKFDGKVLRIPAGKAAKVPDYVAYHFIGNPDVINGEDGIVAAAEKKRVYMRYAAFSPEDRAKKVPKLRIEPIEEMEVQIVDVKKEEVKENKATEPEFPELKPELKKDSFKTFTPAKAPSKK